MSKRREKEKKGRYKCDNMREKKWNWQLLVPTPAPLSLAGPPEPPPPPPEDRHLPPHYSLLLPMVEPPEFKISLQKKRETRKKRNKTAQNNGRMVVTKRADGFNHDLLKNLKVYLSVSWSVLCKLAYEAMDMDQYMCSPSKGNCRRFGVWHRVC